MSTIAKPFLAAFHLPRLAVERKEASPRKRRQATIDLIHSSPHLRRDIGLTEANVVSRGR